jgi:hypothetical protein
MIQPETWRRISDSLWNAWAVIGPLVGIFIGAHVTQRGQRNQWMADNKKSEYRELLTTLTKTFTGIVQLRAPGVGLGPHEQRTISDFEAQSLVVIRDRIFIAKEVESMNLIARWNQALRDYDNTLDAGAFDKVFRLITADLQKTATTQTIK